MIRRRGGGPDRSGRDPEPGVAGFRRVSSVEGAQPAVRGQSRDRTATITPCPGLPRGPATGAPALPSLAPAPTAPPQSHNPTSNGPVAPPVTFHADGAPGGAFRPFSAHVGRDKSPAGAPAAAGERGQGGHQSGGEPQPRGSRPAGGRLRAGAERATSRAGRRRTGLPLPSRSRNSRAGGLSRIRGRITLTLSRLVSAYPARLRQRLLNQPLS